MPMSMCIVFLILDACIDHVNTDSDSDSDSLTLGYVCVCTRVCMCMCMSYTYTYIYVCIYIGAGELVDKMSSCICVSLFLCVCAYVHVCVCVYATSDTTGCFLNIWSYMYKQMHAHSALWIAVFMTFSHGLCG